MKKEIVKLAINPEHPQNEGKIEILVTGYVKGNLVIHKRLDSISTTLDQWTITQTQTGMCLGCYLGFLNNAKEKVERLLLVDDWFIKNARFADTSRVTKKRLKELKNVLNAFKWS